MAIVRRALRAILPIALPSALLAASIALSGCWDDECSPTCPDGFACFYGTCLSRGFCPVNDPHADTCARYSNPDSGTGVECLQRVDHGICNRGYVCECQTFDIDGRCTERQCVESTEEY